MLINGLQGDTVSVHDRGLLYGDGVFRTMRICGGQVFCWPRHYRKLQQDCAALGISCPELLLLSEELQQLSQKQPNGVAKIIITRGQSTRGYQPATDSIPTRIVSIAPAPDYPESFYTQGVKLHLCNLRLAHQPQLAGIKHLNRLENVLAAAEWRDQDMAEGLLLDESGYVIEGTRSNLFCVQGNELLTPDLSRCGVTGVQRERVLEWAVQHGVKRRIEQFTLAQFLEADEVFLVNSMIGLWPVRELQSRTWNRFPFSLPVQKWLNDAHN